MDAVQAKSAKKVFVFLIKKKKKERHTVYPWGGGGEEKKNLLDLIGGQLWEAEIREQLQGENLAADLRQQSVHAAFTDE